MSSTQFNYSQSSSQFHYSQYCLICLNKCPMSGIRYPWSSMKEYFEGTMEHFRQVESVFIFLNNRRIYLKKKYFLKEFNRSGFWASDPYYSSWRVRYNGPYKKFKLKRCND